MLCLALAALMLGLLSVRAWEDPDVHAGPLFDEFGLTLDAGHRTEVMGPLFYSEKRETRETWAFPPLLSHTRDPDTDWEEFHFLYPLMTYNRFGDQYRWQFFQLLSQAGGRTQTETNRNRFTIYPFYFQQRSSDPSQNYTAFLPFYGHTQHRLMRDEVFVVMFPLYSHTRRRDIITDNYLWPIFDVRHGNGLRGWQAWPFVGNEYKDVTTKTNGFGDVTMVPGHESFFALWPLYFNDHTGIGTPDLAWQVTSLPLFSVLRSPARDQTTVIWPFFNYVDDRQKKYREWDAPWPLIVFARGEGKHANRVFPFFSKAHTPKIQDDFYLWPVYKYYRIQSPPLDRRRTRICFYLYSDTTDKNTETGASRRGAYLWPFYTYRRDFNGNRRLQVLALMEPFMPGSEGIRRDYSPLWSIWRSEKNAETGASSQSLLWNLYRHQTTPTEKKSSLLFGLFQYRSSPEGKSMRVFYIPFGRTKSPAQASVEAHPARAASNGSGN